MYRPSKKASLFTSVVDMNLSLLKYLNLKSSAITPSILMEIGSAFGYKVDLGEPETAEIVKYLVANDVHALSDVLGRPEMFDKFKAFLKPAVKETAELQQCPHCGEFILAEAN